MVDVRSLASSTRRPASPEQLRQLYASLPLPSERCIRILDVQYGDDGEASLHGTLRVVDLQTSPAFTTLSYVWGAPAAAGDEDTIRCNGVDVPVTPSCHEALLAVARIASSSRRNSRNSNNNAPIFTIWVDAICINQADDGEQDVQIPLMHEIYTWASTLYVWLGRGTPASDCAIDWLAAAARFVPKHPGMPWLDDRTRCKTVWRDRVRAVAGYIRSRIMRTMYKFHCFPRGCHAVSLNVNPWPRVYHACKSAGPVD